MGFMVDEVAQEQVFVRDYNISLLLVIIPPVVYIFIIAP
jgi:hypothetical protein